MLAQPDSSAPAKAAKEQLGLQLSELDHRVLAARRWELACQREERAQEALKRAKERQAAADDVVNASELPELDANGDIAPDYAEKRTEALMAAARADNATTAAEKALVAARTARATAEANMRAAGVGGHPVVDHVPRRYLAWVNKPQRNRIVADFAGFSCEVTALSMSSDGEMVALGFRDGTIQVCCVVLCMHLGCTSLSRS